MNRFLKNSQPGLRGYAGLVMFAVAYLCVLALLFTPKGSLLSSVGATVSTFTP